MLSKYRTFTSYFFRVVNTKVLQQAGNRCLYTSSRQLNIAKKEPILVNVPETKVTTLPNGLSVASEENEQDTCTVGLWIDAGSRFETEANNGVAHFLEHMAFKGTRNRTQTRLELEVENMGAHLNAYTSREQTVYYCKCFRKDLHRAMEILADILLSSVYEKNAIERERHTILREVQEIEYNLQEVTFDLLHQTAFQGTPLSFTILGPEKNIRSINRDDLVAFVTEHYKGPRMVVAGTGGIDHSQLVQLSGQYFGQLGGTPGAAQSYLDDKAHFTGSRLLHEDRNMPQLHCAIAFGGPGWQNGDNIPLMIANSLVGMWERTSGGGASILSRLGRICGQFDLCHSFQQFSTCYIDIGLWGIYFVCEPRQGRRLVDSILNEWLRLCQAVSYEEITRAKNLLKANLLLQLDGSTPICEDIGRQMLCYGRRMPLHELEARIDLVDADLIRSVLTSYVVGNVPAIAALGRTSELPGLKEIAEKLSGKYNPDL